MKSWFLPSAENPLLEWIAFCVFLILLIICLGGFLIWFRTKKRPPKRRKQRQRQQRSNALSLATLPPKQAPAEAPKPPADQP